MKTEEQGDRCRAVIFDLDGTLVDSLDDIADSAEAVLAERGFAGHPRTAYSRFIGEGIEILIERALPEGRRDEAMVAACSARMREVYRERLLCRTQPYPGIPELIEALRARDIPMAVLSNKPDEPTCRIVDALFPGAPFTRVQGALIDIPKKPDPSAALAIAEAVGVPLSEWLFVGDTVIDMRTARAAQMVSVGVLWGFRPEEVREARPDHLITQPAQVSSLLTC